MTQFTHLKTPEQKMLWLLAAKLVEHARDSGQVEECEADDAGPAGAWCHDSSCPGFCEYACGAIWISYRRDADGDVEVITEVKNGGTLRVELPEPGAALEATGPVAPVRDRSRRRALLAELVADEVRQVLRLRGDSRPESFVEDVAGRVSNRLEAAAAVPEQDESEIFCDTRQRLRTTVAALESAGAELRRVADEWRASSDAAQARCEQLRAMLPNFSHVETKAQRDVLIQLDVERRAQVGALLAVAPAASEAWCREVRDAYDTYVKDGDSQAAAFCVGTLPLFLTAARQLHALRAGLAQIAGGRTPDPTSPRRGEAEPHEGDA